jgi:hypothetical protein
MGLAELWEGISRLLVSRSDELFTRQFAVAILIEVFEAGFEVVFAFESGLVFFEAESVIQSSTSLLRRATMSG